MLEKCAVVRDFRDLVCWQLAYELKCEVFAFTATGPRDSARFYEIARASIMETQNHLIDGRDRGYLEDNLYFRLANLARAALKSTTNLMRSKQRDADRLGNRSR